MRADATGELNAQRGSFWAASRSSSSWKALRLSASSGAKNSSSSCLIDRAEPGELAPAGGGDADHVAAAVLRVALAHDQVALLERVEQRDEPARVERERVGDRRLRLAVALGEDRQDAVVVELEAGLLGSRDRLRLEPHAEPREQEPAARRRAPVATRWIGRRSGSAVAWFVITK